MEANVVFPPRPRGNKGEMVNEPTKATNRQVLRDIGNLETLIPGGKQTLNINRPITRSFRAQLLANAQAAEKNKNPVVAVDDGISINRNGRKVKKVVEAKKLSNKPKPETVVVLSSDDEESVDEKEAEKQHASDKVEPENLISTSPNEEEVVESVSGRGLAKLSTRKKIKTLTSILIARSKASCGAASIELKDPIVNIDATDANNEFAAVEYVDDLYQFYKSTENENRVHDFLCSQPDITLEMRRILLDWLIEVHCKFELMPETLYLTINIVDRCLSMKVVKKDELQLVGISSMLIACKYEEIWAPQVEDFVYISSNSYAGEHIRAMEKAILGKLEWYLTVPTPYMFLVRYIKSSVLPDDKMENMVFFLAELGLLQYSAAVLYCPSMIAAAAVYAARCTLNRTPFWTETLKHHTGYPEEQLMNCAMLLVGCHQKGREKGLSGLYKKFSSPDRGAVALLPPATSLLAASPLQ